MKDNVWLVMGVCGVVVFGFGWLRRAADEGQTASEPLYPYLVGISAILLVIGVAKHVSSRDKR